MSNINKSTLSPITQGVYKSYSMTVYDKNNNPVNLSNKTVYFTIKRDIDDKDSDALFQKIFLITSPSPINLLTIDVNTAESLDLEAGAFPYDIKISFSDSPKEIQFSLNGTITIEQTVTKDALR